MALTVSPNPEVDSYLAQGCGRCPLGGTPDCKVHSWQPELRALRALVQDCGLQEELKWKVPCYTFEGRNILLVTCFREYACLSFFKGVLLKDPHRLLERPGENSQSARIVRITAAEQVRQWAPILKALVEEAVAVEVAGRKVDFGAKQALVFPQELLDRFAHDPVFAAAFRALTPGRQRGYTLFFSAPKQAKIRLERIQKCVPKILIGKGLQD